MEGRTIMNIVGIYLLCMNILGFSVMGADKSKAKRGLWRVPEKTIFLIAALGGSGGVWLGMYTFRHKTRHLTFTVGIPLVMILQVILLFYLR